MADPTPICDVLSEAMEYLSKLGTNIRIRSENLKDKRIRREKLRNTHAIHKAVDKVLLICELSKKSIENVETGVKNLLLQIEKSGSSYGPGSKYSGSTGTSENDVQFEYFTFQARRLKIRNKISVGHYTSVKVLTTAMTLSMIEKYPVYHDCKLYRMRNKLKSEILNASGCTEIKEVAPIENDPPQKDVVETKSTPKLIANISKNMQICETTLNEDCEIALVEKILNLQINNTTARNDDIAESVCNEEDHDINVQQSMSLDRDDKVTKKEDSNNSDMETKPKKKKHMHKTKKYKHIRVIDDSSNSDDPSKNVVEKCKESDKVSPHNSDSKNNSDIEKSQMKEPIENTTLSEGNVGTSKPMIKCVSLSKLLKPERIENINTQNKVEPKITKTEDSQIKKRQERFSEADKSMKSKLNYKKETLQSSDNESDATYWIRKRREVKKFKPKNFNINIIRLGKITESLLENYNLNRITQNGLILCERISQTKKEKCDGKNTNDLEPKSNTMIPSQCKSSLKDEEINKVKNALLVDSDSDNDGITQGARKEVENIIIENENIVAKQSKINSPSESNDVSKIKELSCDKQSDKVLESENIIPSHLVEQGGEMSSSQSKSSPADELEVEMTYKENMQNESTTTLEHISNREEENQEVSKSLKSGNALGFDKRKSEDVDKNAPNDKTRSNKKLKLQRPQTAKRSRKVENVKNKKSLLCNDSNSEAEYKKNSEEEKEMLENSCCELKTLEELDSANSSGAEGGKAKKFKESHKEKSKELNTRDAKDASDSELGITVTNHRHSENPEKNCEASVCEVQEKNTETKAGSESPNQKMREDWSVIKSSLLEDSDSESHNGKEPDCNTDKEEDIDNTKNVMLDDFNSQSHNEEISKTGNMLNKTELDKQAEKSNSAVPEKLNDADKINSFLNKSAGELGHLNELDSSEDKSVEAKDNQNTFKKGEENFPTHKHKRTRSSCSKDTEIVKSSLLNDSSDDLSKTPQKRKSDSEDSPPQTKRKCIMESMYAKKMLLTYSSSSDTEDEQLRNTLKEIKDDLLKGISSDEDGNIKKKDLSDKDNEHVEGFGGKKHSSESDTSQDLTENGLTKQKITKKVQSDTDTQDTSSKGRGSITDNSSKSKMGSSRATSDSCSQNSDNQDAHDKEIDGLTNLKTLEKCHRRRDSTSTEHTRGSRSARRLRRMAKASGLISNEGFLQAESSSDGASLSGSDHADAADLEEMPTVNIPDLNGDSIGHLAKDDLLGESDTSVSHDEKGDHKKDDTDEDNVKSKRRKAIAISSDSEAGSSRRKEHAVRLSDFEDSEDESSEPMKNKRKKVVDSDASAGSSADDGKKKRRRIKTLDDSDMSGSDSENEGRNKHGRKNIRKVMGKNQLEEATKKAAREEKERIARITERQKLYNNLEFDESGKPDEVVLEKVVLDFDPETKEPLIQVDRGLVKKLKPHQANGIKFMWDACFESVKRIKKDKGSGCILAHCMGLGKTLQVVSLTHTLLTHGTLTGVSRVLVVCPLSTVLNWVNEFRMWLKHAEDDFEVDVYELSKFKQNSERSFQLSQWFQHGGVCVLGYEMFRNLSAEKGKKFKKKMLKHFQESLVDPGPDLVVCDEGHLLKNEKTSLSQSMNRVKTRRRIVLTGTPLQNNLKEYYCMVQFVKPNLLGKYNEYLNRFVNPITNGQYTDSTEHDIRVMKRRSHVLHKMLDGAVQRRDYGVLAPFLPPKHEYVLFITLTEVQIKLYHHYLDNYSRRPQPGKSSGFLFPDFQSLQRIWTHPLVLKYNSERYEIMQQKKREREEEDSEGSLVDFIDDDSTPDESSTEESSDDLSDVSDDSGKKKKKKDGKKKKSKDSKVSARRGTRANPIEIDDDEPIETLEVKNENPTEWWMKLMGEEELEDMRNSHKLILLFDILRQCEAIGDKLLVFSQSLYSLDLIEHFLGKVDEATQEGRVDEKLGGHVGSWSQGVDYFRLDGSTSCENRSIWCKNFNREDNPRARLFLISTRAGGLGINLVAANRVVIFDVSWNPSHDVQSIFRVYRFGQKKPCYIYRFLAMGTMEEKIYERQVTKQAISKRVIDEQQIDRHYAENDLAELYKFEPQPPLPRPLPPLPKDRLFAEMLKEHEAQIYKYHEHDSLLENKEEETLSEEERRAAWEDFENEKTRPPPQPFISPYAMHNGMVQGLLAQQQQQMAFAALTAMLRKDMPNMSEQQLRDMQSLIMNSPGMMQKMGDMYKYAQPGMMNPAMMNPMTAGSGMSGMGAMGGASGLQYEPPWQRQQQQQHQMRLQQLMQQQQNSMGAKYYAGGLGSRDPMAMALQQQRARELMHRPRPRGRPPLAATAPRPPPPAQPHAADVVDLDSD